LSVAEDATYRRIAAFPRISRRHSSMFIPASCAIWDAEHHPLYVCFVRCKHTYMPVLRVVAGSPEAVRAFRIRCLASGTHRLRPAIVLPDRHSSERLWVSSEWCIFGVPKSWLASSIVLT
jgi:hypothetical protein